MSRTNSSTHIVHITDTTDRTACLKIASAYARHTMRNGLFNAFFNVAAAVNTLDIGVTASELVTNSERPDRLLLGLNCAPPDRREGTVDNARKDFYFADLDHGVFTGGTLNGMELSYVKPLIRSLNRLVVTNELKSQFRSLEVLPRYLIDLPPDQSGPRCVKTGY